MTANMSPPDLRLLADKLARDDYDPRHRLLDLAGDFQAAVQEGAGLPAALLAELDELCEELDEVRPRFPSHRESSVLFDREGLGQAGRDRAKRLLARMAGAAQAILKHRE
jgi:hypothetical protein